MSRSRSRSRTPETREKRGPPPNSEDLFSCVISGIPRDFKEEDLREHFDKFGKIGDVFVPRDRYEGGNRGFGFIRFVEKDDRDDAVDEFDKEPLRLDGKDVKVETARDRPRPGKPGWDPERARRDRDRRDRRRSRSRSRSRSRDRSRDRSRRSRRDRDRYSRSRSRDRSDRRRSDRRRDRSYSRSRSRS